jgi:hypothetical protein
MSIYRNVGEGFRLEPRLRFLLVSHLSHFGLPITITTPGLMVKEQRFRPVWREDRNRLDVVVPTPDNPTSRQDRGIFWQAGVRALF